MQQRGFETATEYRGGEELASSLQVECRCQLCQGQDPYGQRYVGTHHVGHESQGPLAVVPNSTCSIAVGKATKLVVFVHQLPGKSLREPPSGEAVVTNNIVVSPVGKDALSLGDSQ